MEHFDEKIVPTFKVSPNSPAAAAAAVVNTCGLTATSPSRILSGSFTNYLGLSGVSSPDFGTAHSTPKSISQKVAISFHKTSRNAKNVDNRLVMGESPVGSYLLEKINSNKYKKVNAVEVKQTRKQNLVFFYLQDCPGMNNMNLIQYPFAELTYLLLYKLLVNLFYLV